MTQWNDSSVAHYAKQAGFKGPHLVMAVALALSWSQGQDADTLDVYGDETVVYAGLWGINRNNELVAGMNLYDPQGNADAAFRLFNSPVYGPWQWSPSFRANLWQTEVMRAQAAAIARYTPQTVSTIVTEGTAQQAINRLGNVVPQGLQRLVNEAKRITQGP